MFDNSFNIQSVRDFDADLISNLRRVLAGSIEKFVCSKTTLKTNKLVTLQKQIHCRTSVISKLLKHIDI